MFKGLAAIGAGCVLVLLLSGCGGQYQQQRVDRDRILGQQRYVAVLPLVNLTSHPEAGRIVGDLLATELYAATSFKFLERTELVRQISQEEDLELVMDKAAAQQIGEKLGVDTVIYGSVGEYGYLRGLDQGPAVSVTLRLLDVPSGQVLWAASRSESDGCFAVCVNSVSETAQRLLASMVNDMLQTPGN
ncbi:MAG: polysaccharide biosynthesis protein PelC [Desulfovibrionales bacterium]|jgi:TolB-like protein|nr:polysaccharide biosynthesis protein PelC [Desulfovibrionales bacterium]